MFLLFTLICLILSCNAATEEGCLLLPSEIYTKIISNCYKKSIVLSLLKVNRYIRNETHHILFQKYKLCSNNLNYKEKIKSNQKTKIQDILIVHYIAAALYEEYDYNVTQFPSFYFSTKPEIFPAVEENKYLKILSQSNVQFIKKFSCSNQSFIFHKKNILDTLKVNEKIKALVSCIFNSIFHSKSENSYMFLYKTQSNILYIDTQFETKLKTKKQFDIFYAFHKNINDVAKKQHEDPASCSENYSQVSSFHHQFL